MNMSGKKKAQGLEMSWGKWILILVFLFFILYFLYRLYKYMSGGAGSLKWW